MEQLECSESERKLALTKPAQQPAAHSPLPWRVSPDDVTIHCGSKDDPEIVAITEVNDPMGQSGFEAEENAKLIVRAVNHADKLAEVLREAYDFIDILLANTSSEATDLLTNHGEDVNARLETALKAYEADRA